MVKVGDLQSGEVKRIKVSQFAKFAGESVCTIYRKIKNGVITAITDPATGRIFIPAEAALAYLSGEQYKHDHQDSDAISRMEHARKGWVS
ncbi:MAG: hypothetical protein K2X81_10925 [Candidatus Obscuribacterales bacterium]|nr:hypothetical protein [Candidatus Obscuribacterales bacterium]